MPIIFAFLLPSLRARSAWRGGVGGGAYFGILIGRRTRGETPTPNPSPPLRGGRGENNDGLPKMMDFANGSTHPATSCCPA
jgi:hypothetical protein